MLTERIGRPGGPREDGHASSQATVYEAARLMLEQAIGAILVVDKGALVGIFTERDAVLSSRRARARSRFKSCSATS
jgi:CBS domain-containing protein